MQNNFWITDIGYKYYGMPSGLSIDDYFLILDTRDAEWIDKLPDQWTTRDRKEYANTIARLQILTHLDSISEPYWSERERELLDYVVSDLDFYASEWQFGEICKLCRRNN